jgi:hypothetical protein
MGSSPSAPIVADLRRDRDWAGLWRVALDLPLAETVAAVAQIDRRWRPADQPGRELLSRLAAAQPAQVRAATAPPPSVQLSPRWRHQGSRCEFAPDGSAVAVEHYPSSAPVIYHELPSGRRKRGFRAFADGAAVFDGGMVFAATGSYPVTPWFRYLPGRGSEMLGQVRQQATGNRAAAVKGGFLIAEPARLLYGTAEPGSPLRDVTPPALQLDGDRDVFHDVVADPLTGRLAVHVVRRGTVSRDDVLILGQDFSVAGQITVPFDERWRAVCALGFCQPDLFVTLHGVYRDRRLRSWAVGQPAVAEAETDLKEAPYAIQTLPYTGLIRNGHSYLDAKTLGPAACPIALTWEQQSSSGYITSVRLSRDGGYAAVSQSRLTTKEGDKKRRKLLVRDLVQQEVSEWAARPMAGFSADDLAAVTVLHERTRGRPSERAAVLLRACLEYRAARR